MEMLNDPKNILTNLEQLLHQIKRLATYTYSESNAFALTLLNRKRLAIEDTVVENLLNNSPAEPLHKSRTLKSILLCYRPSVRRRLKAIDNTLEKYYRDGLAGLQAEVEAMINMLRPGLNDLQVS